MVKRYHRLDACSSQVFGEFDVMIDTLLVDRIIASTKWDDTRP